MSYVVTIKRRAQKSLARIDPVQRAAIVQAIKGLSDNPRPTGCQKLAGRDAWRIRIGNFRVIYEINDQQLSILVVVIGHRKDAYR